jgi:hypothetical protein
LRRHLVSLRLNTRLDKNKTYDSMNDTLKDINAFNVKYAKDNRAAAITPASIRKSLKGHRDTTARTHNGITISPLMQYAIERSNAEYKR